MTVAPDVLTRAEAANTAPARAPHHRTRGQWAAWGFLTPVVVYLAAFYAYPLYRNLDLSLHKYTVRSFVQGGAPFRAWTTTAPCSTTRRSGRR